MAIQKPANKMEIILLSFAAIIVILVLCLSALEIYNLVSKDEDTASEMAHEKSQKGYFAVPEWGIQMKIPDTLTDVRYEIIDGRDSVVFVAKPKGANVKYSEELDSGFVKYSRVQLYCTTEKSIADKHGYFEKIGEYYYVIFSSSTAVGSFGDDNNTAEYENAVVEDLKVMLNSVQAAK
jgi:hypothetical protein